MVRNWDTVRAILLKLEAATTAHTTLTLDQVDGIAPQEVGYHMMLLKDAGLIEANILKSSSGDGACSTADLAGSRVPGQDPRSVDVGQDQGEGAGKRFGSHLRCDQACCRRADQRRTLLAARSVQSFF